mmetsp:Transcript_27160/g.24040  ORF Transcript_27160/g.24040 Transcript_27160/m.24040 type:complete len:148 (+) Transcript_27160:188-631(+)
MKWSLFLNKINTRKEVFKLFDNANNNRIDTMDLFSIIQLSSVSKIEGTILNMMKIFGFVTKIFTRDEFNFYLDSLFSGIITTAITKGNKVPHKEMKGYRVRNEDIEALVTDIFGEEELLDRENFTIKFQNHPELYPMFKYFQDRYTI